MLIQKQQNILEYILVTVAVVTGLLLIQLYKKHIEANRPKSAIEDPVMQFDPDTYTGDFTVYQESATRQAVKKQVAKTDYLKDQLSIRTGRDFVAVW